MRWSIVSIRVGFLYFPVWKVAFSSKIVRLFRSLLLSWIKRAFSLFLSDASMTGAIICWTMMRILVSNSIHWLASAIFARNSSCSLYSDSWRRYTFSASSYFSRTVSYLPCAGLVFVVVWADAFSEPGFFLKVEPCLGTCGDYKSAI